MSENGISTASVSRKSQQSRDESSLKSFKNPFVFTKSTDHFTSLSTFFRVLCMHVARSWTQLSRWSLVVILLSALLFHPLVQWWWAELSLLWLLWWLRSATAKVQSVGSYFQDSKLLLPWTLMEKTNVCYWQLLSTVSSLSLVSVCSFSIEITED